MINDNILSIKKCWEKTKTIHKEGTFLFMPVPIICAKSQADAEYTTKQLSIYIYTKRIVQKTASTHADYLFFPVPYTAPHSKFHAIQELYQHLRNASGFYGTYCGILLLDVSEWVGHFRDEYFDILLSFLADQRLNGLIPFFYADCKDSSVDILALEAVVSSYFKIAKINISMEDLCEYAVSILADSDVMLADDARLCLDEFIREASRSVLFHGTESIRHICEEIIVNRKSRQSQKALGEAQLKKIIENHGCMDIYHVGTERVIGFR